NYGDPITVFDTDGVLTLINIVGAKNLGGTPEEFVGKSMGELFPDKAHVLMKRNREVMESGERRDFEDEFELPKGTRWFLSNIQPVKARDGKTFGVQIISHDITERKLMEEELRKSSEKIKLFAYSVSHDLKSPAVGLYGVTRLLHKHYRHVLDERARKYCDQIMQAAEQIADLVWKINVYISTKEIPLNVARVKPKEILQMVKDEFSAQLDLRGVQWVEPENMPDIRVDRLSILRVLRNLVENALKHGGDGLSKITVGYERSDLFHILSVGNDGVGIRGEVMEKIFGPFQRHETSGDGEGAGLGLAIVKEVAEQHGGKVWVESDPGEGPTFYISILRDL
ncbi:MAG: PAS domain-containing sensor histidine kinase, partial [Thermodesulfobacteriota bacterium]|nr:PAS domain-containing sensor histidine kinase [Thermodesulfobacteriota bacterium]